MFEVWGLFSNHCTTNLLLSLLHGEMTFTEMGDRLATIDMGRKLGAVPPFLGGGLGPHLTQAYFRTKWHLDSSSRLATIDICRKFRAVSPF